MSRKSKNGFRKLENHELTEFTTLQGEDSGSDSEMVELSREDSSGRGSACCWCVALYLVLLTCFLVLMSMVAIYFGYNMMRISNDYSHRLDSLEDKVSQLDSRLDSTRQEYSAKMEQLQKLVSQLNTSFFTTRDSVKAQNVFMQDLLGTVKASVDTLQKQVTDFESHPPTIGEDEVQKMRSNMAEFKSHLESYDSQLSDVMRTVGDARHELSQTDERVELLKRNVTSLKGSLSGLQLQDQDTANSLELLSAQFSALQTVVREINETVSQEVVLTREEFNETRSGLEHVHQQLSALRAELSGLSSDIDELNDTLNQGAGEEVVPTKPTDSTTQSTTVPPEPSTETTSPTTGPTKPATGPTKPATEPTKPATEPASETTEPPKPETEPTNPATEPTKPIVEPTNSTTATLPTMQPNNSNSTLESSTDATPQSIDSTLEPTSAVASSSEEGSGTTAAGASDDNEPSNEKEQPMTAPPSGQPVTTGTHTVDSTGATEDIPASAGDLNVTSENITGSETGQQPPTLPSVVPAVPTQNETDTPSPSSKMPPAKPEPIKALQALLDGFDYLDGNTDGCLDIYEFSGYFQGSSASQSVFEKLDANRDYCVTKEEIIMAIRMLEEKTDAGTASPESNSEGNAAETPSPPLPEGMGPETEASSSSGTTESLSFIQLLEDILHNFQLLDTNGDGSLDQNEFSFYFGGSADNVLTLFYKLDGNSNQLVTEDEISNTIRLLAETTTGNGAQSLEAPAPEEEKSVEDQLADYMNSGGNNNF